MERGSKNNRGEGGCTQLKTKKDKQEKRKGGGKAIREF